jgi:hypothetical protein
VIWREQLLTSGHFGSSHFVNQFPRPARKNGHPVLSSRFLSRVLVKTISSHLKYNLWRKIITSWQTSCCVFIEVCSSSPHVHSKHMQWRRGATGGGGSLRGRRLLFLQELNFESLPYSYEWKLRTVFKQFRSNLNRKFLSETLPRFSTICKNVRKSLIPNVMLFYIQSILVFSVMQRVKLFQSMAKSVQLYWLEVIKWVSIQGNLTNIAPPLPPPPKKNRAQW